MYLYFSIHQVYCYLEFYLEMKGEGERVEEMKGQTEIIVKHVFKRV